MMRRLILSVGCLVLAASTGCSMCSSAFDYDYGAYGGRWDRVDRCRGRVGSAFEPAEARLLTADDSETVDPGAMEPDEPAPQPTADE